MDGERPARSWETAQQKAARAIFLIMRRPMRHAILARRLGMTSDGLWKMLAKISQTLPIYYDKKRKTWCMCFDGEEEAAKYER